MHQNGHRGSHSTRRVQEATGLTGPPRIKRLSLDVPGALDDQFKPSQRQNVTAINLDPEEQLALDWALFQSVESGASEIHCRCWQTRQAVVVVGRNNHVAADVVQDACHADGVKVLRRCSGGGSVVLGPGCLNYVVVLSLVSWPELTDVAASFQCILDRMVVALDIPGLSVAGGTDLALGGRKVSGNSQRRGRRALMQHGTLLFEFEPQLATRYLKEPLRQPAYRMARRHAEFLGNIPLPAETIRVRLERAWSNFTRLLRSPH